MEKVLTLAHEKNACLFVFRTF